MPPPLQLTRLAFGSCALLLVASTVSFACSDQDTGYFELDTDSTSGTGTGGSTGSGSASSGGGSQSSGSTTASGGSSNPNGSGGTQSMTPPCTNTPPPPDPEREVDLDCDGWATTPECDADWFKGYCEKSCGKCQDEVSGGGGGTGTGGGSQGSGGSIGQGNPWGSVNGGQSGWASRYWDCCKQSCSWPGKGGNSPVNSCESSGENLTSQDTSSACDGGNATTCNSYTPWTYSSEVSFGFVATHSGSGVSCGTCYHLQFTGSSHNGGDDPGSKALKDKTMIVMATNIGDDVNSDGQLDLLIPGGGTGARYGCDAAWGVSANSQELGAKYGGLRSGCSGGLDSIKGCVANKCQSLFGSRGLDEMYDACMWYVDWFQAADNPSFRFETIECPSELTSVAK